MLLKTVIDHLKTGEFSLVNLGGNDEEGVTSNNVESIINHINIGLVNLYTRFNLHMGEIQIQQYAHIQRYKLNKAYAQSNAESAISAKYLIDTDDEPFNDNVLVVTNVYDELGCELPLNDSAYENSVYTPSYNVIQVPCPDDENAMTVIYRAGPDLLEVDGCNLEQDVPVPIQLLEALLYFVAYRFKATRPDVESIAESNNYFMRYKEVCDVTSMQGLYNAPFKTNSKLEERGFV